MLELGQKEFQYVKSMLASLVVENIISVAHSRIEILIFGRFISCLQSSLSGE